LNDNKLAKDFFTDLGKNYLYIAESPQDAIERVKNILAKLTTKEMDMKECKKS